MPCVARFGIIEAIDAKKDYSAYEPEKYNLVAIDDDIFDDWWDRLTQIKTYFHNLGRPSNALARWGVTLIPPESLEALIKIAASDKRAEYVRELSALIVLLEDARQRNKFVIHYGV